MESFKVKKLPGIGEQIEIIPNHSCVVMNLNEDIYLKRNGKMTKIYNKGRLKNY